jgi:hypothetical protein
MTPARCLSLLAALLIPTACADPEAEERQRCAETVSQRLTQAPTALLVVGRPATVTVQADSIPECLAELEPGLAPELLTSDVYGPDNTRVPSDIQLNPGGPPWAATLRFTPRVPGAYHAIVSFSPVGGLQQFMMLAGTDRTEAPGTVELNQDRCSHLDRTTRGTWLCDGSALSPGARTWQNLGAYAKVAVAGDVVWLTDLGRVRRFVDTGTSLELTATLSPPEGLGNTRSRLATEDELVLLDSATITRITFAPDQGLTAWPAFRLPARPRWSFGTDVIDGLLLRSGERLLWVTLSSYDRSGEAATSVCPLRRQAEGGILVEETPCQTVPGTPVGSEPDVLWLRTRGPAFIGSNAPQYVVHRWVVRDGALVNEGMLAPHNLASFTGNQHLGFGPMVPVLFQNTGGTLAVPAWNEEPGVLGLELFNVSNSGLVFASPRFFWTNRPGLVRVFPR